MDARQQTINSFTGGLNMDLHPLTTPNNILTDCLNGTILTYNGNEYILQNDMGNIKLPLAQLDNGYIPVGMKEFGNIIYIVSYNPIIKKCQIGSYPSPQTIFNNDVDDKTKIYEGVEIEKINNSEWEELKKNLDKNAEKKVYYTQIIQQEKLQVYSLDENFNLKTGDKYYIWSAKDEENNSEWDDYTSSLEYQSLKFYVLGEDKKIYDIDDQVIVNNEEFNPESTSMNNVKWEVPGWLCYKESILSISSFDIFVDQNNAARYVDLLSTESEKEQNTTSISIEVTIQAQINVPAKTKWEDVYKDLGVLYKLDKEDTVWLEQNFTSGPIENTKYNNSLLQYNINIPLTINVEKDKSSIQLSIVPFLRSTSGSNNGVPTIIYNNHWTEININLNKILNIRDINPFKTFKYLVDDNNVNVEFIIDAYSETDIKTGYAVHKLTKKSTDEQYLNWVFCTKDVQTEGITEKDLEDKFLTDYGIIEKTFDLPGQNFQSLNIPAESGIYLFSVCFWNEPKEGEQAKIYYGSKVILASKCMNSFYQSVSDFNNIPAQDWIASLQKLITFQRNFDLTKKSTESIKTYWYGESISDLLNLNLYKPETDSAATIKWMEEVHSGYALYANIDQYQLNKEKEDDPLVDVAVDTEPIRKSDLWKGLWDREDVKIQVSQLIDNTFQSNTILNNTSNQLINIVNAQGVQLSTYIRSTKNPIKEYLYNKIPIPFNSNSSNGYQILGGPDNVHVEDKLNQAYRDFIPNNTPAINNPVAHNIPGIFIQQFPNYKSGNKKNDDRHRTRIKGTNQYKVGYTDFDIIGGGMISDSNWWLELYNNNSVSEFRENSERFWKWCSDYIKSTQFLIIPIQYSFQHTEQPGVKDGGFSFSSELVAVEGVNKAYYSKCFAILSLVGGYWTISTIKFYNDKEQSGIFNKENGNFTCGTDGHASVFLNIEYQKALKVLQILGLFTYRCAGFRAPIDKPYYNQVTEVNIVSSGNIEFQYNYNSNKALKIDGLNVSEFFEGTTALNVSGWDRLSSQSETTRNFTSTDINAISLIKSDSYNTSKPVPKFNKSDDTNLVDKANQIRFKLDNEFNILEATDTNVFVLEPKCPQWDAFNSIVQKLSFNEYAYLSKSDGEVLVRPKDECSGYPNTIVSYTTDWSAVNQNELWNEKEIKISDDLYNTLK